MADDPTTAELIPAVQRRGTLTTKTASIAALLRASRGATVSELGAATAWQPHTVRAHLTRIRKTGKALERVERKSGPAAYRFAREESEAAPVNEQLAAVDEGSSND